MRLVVGESIVDLHPDGVGRAGSAASYRRRPGGAPANVAVGLARLGDPPHLWTRVGEDGFGDFLDATLAGEGIPARFRERDGDAPTGLAVVGRDADADRSFALYLADTACTRLRAGRLPDDALAGVEWLHVGGVLLAFEPARTAIRDLLDRAPPDATVSFDPNARPGTWTRFDYPETLARTLPDVDVVIASPADLRPAGYDGDADSLAAALVDGAGPHTALVTRGAAGAVGRATDAAPWGAAEASHPGFPVDSVDTTGAGDAFTAGAVEALSGGNALADALQFANAVAAASTTAEGAMAALPTRDAVESRLTD